MTGGEIMEGGEGLFRELFRVETDPLFSATTLSDFSNTFQSLIVLSKSKVSIEKYRSDLWSKTLYYSTEK